MIVCPICNREFLSLAVSHLKYKHNISVKAFRETYPNFIFVSEEKRKIVSESCKKAGCGKCNKGKILSKIHRERISRATKGVNNPFYGKKHTLLTQQKMSKNHADFNGDKNPYKIAAKRDPQLLVRQARSWRKQYWNKLKRDPVRFKRFCEERSKIVSNSIAKGKCCSYGRGHKHGYFYSRKQDLKMYFRSSWEESFLLYCEKSEPIKTFVNCPIVIPYKFNGNIKNYLPDFLLNNHLIVEIKPSKISAMLQSKMKRKALKGFCKNNKNYAYVWVTEKELKNLDKYVKSLSVLSP